MTDNETTKALEEIAQRRKKEVDSKATKPLPSVITAIRSTTVSYTVDSSLFPFKLLDIKILIKLLSERFSLTFKSPSFDPKRLESLGIDASKLTEDNLIQFLIGGDTPSIAFINGRYPAGTDRFIYIEQLDFTRESITVKIEGITDVAEVIVAEAFNLFWQAVGSGKRWESEEVQELKDYVDYGTVTDCDLGQNIKKLLNPELISFLDDNVDSNLKIGSLMSSYTKHNEFKPPTDIFSSWSFDELSFFVHMFDKVHGTASSARVHIDTTKRSNRGTGNVKISSALRFDDHVKLIKKIRSTIESKEKK